MKKAVVIVAGGTGTRMNSDRPKQFIEVAGKPVLAWTMQSFLAYDPDITMVIVLPPEYMDEWQDKCRQYVPGVKLFFAEGGQSRFYSVRNGLRLVGDAGLVAIHDAARPLVSGETIKSCFSMAEERGGSIPVTAVQDSLRIVEGGHSRPLDREKIRRVQTPQVFLADRIQKAYTQEFNEMFTDDASVYEVMFGEPGLITGNRENIKITYPEDLEYAARVLSEKGA